MIGSLLLATAVVPLWAFAPSFRCCAGRVPVAILCAGRVGA